MRPDGAHAGDGVLLFTLLNNIATLLAEHNELSIQVEGHTDDEADDMYNKDLSQRRADAVKA